MAHENSDPTRSYADARHAAGRLTARELLDALFDEASFEVIAPGAEPAADINSHDVDESVVAGHGTVSGRQLFAFASGPAGPVTAADRAKIIGVQERALSSGCPIVGLWECGTPESLENEIASTEWAEILGASVRCGGIVPRIAVITGGCFGIAAQMAALSDFVSMTAPAVLATSGVAALKQIYNQTISEEQLGGAELHGATTGLAHLCPPNDLEAVLQVRRLLEFLPSCSRTDPPLWPGQADDDDRPALETLLPPSAGDLYEMRELVEAIADEGDILVLQEMFAPNLLTAFGRLHGRTIGFVANRPAVLAGALDSAATTKATRFVRFCAGFGVPLVTLVDTPGFLPGVAQEHAGLIGHAGSLIAAYAQARVPRIALITRRASGSAYLALAARRLSADKVFALPGALISPNSADALIRPRDTRRVISEALAALANRPRSNPASCASNGQGSPPPHRPGFA